MDKLRADRMAEARQRMQDFVPTGEEFVAGDLLMVKKEGEDPRSFIVLTGNEGTIILSRGAFEFAMPRILQLVYGARVAEAGIHAVLEEGRRIRGALDDAFIHEVAMQYGMLVVDKHHLEMQEVTPQAEAAAAEEVSAVKALERQEARRKEQAK